MVQGLKALPCLALVPQGLSLLVLRWPYGLPGIEARLAASKVNASWIPRLSSSPNLPVNSVFIYQIVYIPTVLQRIPGQGVGIMLSYETGFRTLYHITTNLKIFLILKRPTILFL